MSSVRTTLRAPSPRRRRPHRTAICTASGLALVLSLTGTTPAFAAESPSQDLGRQVIADGDGWASWSGPTYPERVERTATATTGGADAEPAEVYSVDSWQELRDALAGRTGGTQNDARYNDIPRIIYVTGTIDAWVNADGSTLTCDQIASQITVAGTDAPFSMEDYIAAFGPDVDASGPLEAARVAAAALQATLTLQHVGSNVTLIGVGEDATITGGSLRVRDAHNVIVRNLTLSDAYDCFPQWDANDSGGNWNSAYDNLSIWTSTSVWVDHNTFNDGEHPPTSLDRVYGRPFEVHDGLVDITHGSDLVTLSWNWLQQHDKTDLIGSSDSRTQDRGQHRVTQHHNRWTDIGQRAPRVRYGDVHVYNNLYEQTELSLAEIVPGSEYFQYFWGAGRESSIVAESNAVDLVDPSTADRIIAGWGGTELAETDTLVNGEIIDVLAAYNATTVAPLSSTVRWSPAAAYRYALTPVTEVADDVRAGAGAGILDSGSPVATAAPGRFVLSDDNGWDTGLRDGSYSVSANLWWGQNATVVKLYEGDTLVEARAIDGSSPEAQRVTFDITGKGNGAYEYTLVALNPYGESVTRSHTVTVTDAAPAAAVLSAAGVRTGDVTITADLWWGTNATEYVLYQDGVEVDRQTLVAATPKAQRATTALGLLPPGEHVFTAQLVNAAGTTVTAPLRIRIGG